MDTKSHWRRKDLFRVVGGLPPAGNEEALNYKQAYVFLLLSLATGLLRIHGQKER